MDKLIKGLVQEARDKGLAFVEDDFDEDDIYNPLVIHETAEEWLLEAFNKIKDAKIE